MFYCRLIYIGTSLEVYELNQECTITSLLNQTNSALPFHVSLTVVRMDS